MSGSNLITDFRGFLLQAAGYQNLGARTVTDPADKAIAETDFTIINALDTPAIITYVLPAPSAQSAEPGSRRLRIIDGAGDAATHAITIDGNGANINGSATIQITANWGYVDLEWLGTFWHVLNSLGATSSLALPVSVANGGLGNGTGSAASLNNIPGAEITGNIPAAAITTALATPTIPVQGTTLLASIAAALKVGGVYSIVATQTGLQATSAAGVATGMTVTDGVGQKLAIRPGGGTNSATTVCDPFSVTLANNETFDYDNESLGGGLLIFSSDGTCGALLIFSTAAVTASVAATATVTTTLTTANKLNVGASGGKVRVENKTGGSLNVVGVPFTFSVG